MKKTLKRLTAIVLVALMIIGQIFLAIAASVDITAATKRIGSVSSANENSELTPGISWAGMQGMCVTATGSNNRLFAVNIRESENKVKLYMYKDYTSMTNSDDDDYGTFLLNGIAGHANGLAVDDNYIYITCWSKKTSENGNKILRISRSKLWSMYKATSDTYKGEIEVDGTGCTILSSYYSDGNIYNGVIYSITYYKNGKFIINYDVKSSEKYTKDDHPTKIIYYTTAEVQNGRFVINNSPSEIFCVDTEVVNPKGQDIGYGASNGFFIVLWLGNDTTNVDMTKNTIVWVKLNSLSGIERFYSSSNEKAKYRHINVNKSESIFKKYEMESVSIGSDNCLYANVNTGIKTGYEKYEDNAIIRVERSVPVNNSTKFLGRNIDY